MATKYPLFQSAAQRAHYSKRRKEIWEALHPEPSVDYGREDGQGDGEWDMGGASCATHLETDAMGRKKTPQQAKSFAAATAEVTGESKAQINRNVARAEAIGDDLLRLTGTSQRGGRLCPPLACLLAHGGDGCDKLSYPPTGRAR